MVYIDSAIRSLRPMRLKTAISLSSLRMRRAHIPIDLFGKFIAVVEAPSESLHLVAIASQADNVFPAIVLEVEQKTLLTTVERYTHNGTPFVCKYIKHSGITSHPGQKIKFSLEKKARNKPVRETEIGVPSGNDASANPKRPVSKLLATR